MKKKGLIVATIVMVLVLAASITTATYAWFSATAQAEIRNISVTTQSTEGLQVAVETTDTTTFGSGWTYGTISYTDSKFAGDADGWGTLADFAALRDNVGTMEDAVTIVTSEEVTANKYDGKVWKTADFVAGVYELNDNGTMVVTEDTSAGEGKAYYTADTNPTAGQYLVPLAYDANIVPTCYAYAVKNGTGVAKSADYLELPIGVRSTMNVAAILCTLTVTPDTTNISNQQYIPGMAAACRITLNDGTKSTTIEAYPTVSRGASASTGTGRDTATWTYKFVVAGTGALDSVVALTAKKITYTIWIEGEDDMCHNLTAGSGFAVDIAYAFEKTATNITVNSADYTIAAGTANEGVYNIIF